MTRRLAAGALCALAPLGIALAVPAGAGVPRQRSAEKVRAEALAKQLLHERAQHRAEMRHARARYEPNVQRAITLAAVTFDVDRGRMAAIIWRESRDRPWAKNRSSSAGGLAQFLLSTWNSTPCGKAGLSRFDPYAATVCMAWTVRYGGGWRHWQLTDG